MMTMCSGVGSVRPCPNLQRRSMIGTMAPRRFSTPRTYSGCLGRWVISAQPLISRTDMMSTPYWSSPMENETNWMPAAERASPFH